MTHIFLRATAMSKIPGTIQSLLFDTCHQKYIFIIRLCPRHTGRPNSHPTMVESLISVIKEHFALPHILHNPTQTKMSPRIVLPSGKAQRRSTNIPAWIIIICRKLYYRAALKLFPMVILHIYILLLTTMQPPWPCLSWECGVEPYFNF